MRPRRKTTKKLPIFGKELQDCRKAKRSQKQHKISGMEKHDELEKIYAKAGVQVELRRLCSTIIVIVFRVFVCGVT